MLCYLTNIYTYSSKRSYLNVILRASCQKGISTYLHNWKYLVTQHKMMRCVMPEWCNADADVCPLCADCFNKLCLSNFLTNNSRMVSDWVNEQATKDDWLFGPQKCCIQWPLNYWLYGHYRSERMCIPSHHLNFGKMVQWSYWDVNQRNRMTVSKQKFGCVMYLWN
jgi:hypothetical protein